MNFRPVVVVSTMLAASILASGEAHAQIDWNNPAKSQILNGERPSIQGKRGRSFAIGWVNKSVYAYENAPPCGANVDLVRQNIVDALFHGAAMIGSAFGPGGTVVGYIVGSVLVATSKVSQGSDLHKLIVQGKSYASCEVFSAVIPANAKVLDVTYWVDKIDKREGTHETVPLKNEEWAHWDHPKGWKNAYLQQKATVPVKDKQVPVQIVSAVFKNWSHNHPRLAGLIVAYEVP